MKNKILLAFGLLSLSLVQLGCDAFVQSLKETKAGNKDSLLAEEEPSRRANTVVKQPAEVVNFLADTIALQRVEEALRGQPQFKDKDINIYKSIHFYNNGRVSLQIQHPENPSYVDQYYYSEGSWVAPKAVVLSKHDKVDENVVNLDQLPFKNAHRVYSTVKIKLDAIGASPSDVTVYAITSNGYIRWYPSSISNERSKYSIRFNEDGSLASFEQD